MATPDPTPVPAPAPAPSDNSFVKLLVIGLLLAAVAGGVYYFVANQARQGVVAVDELKTLKTYLAAHGKDETLDAGFTDADGNLLADPPADAAKLVNPPQLVFSAIYTDDPAKAEAEYKPLMEAVSKAAGKPVVFIPPPATPAPPPPGEGEEPAPPPGGRSLREQLDDLKAGKLHVTAFSTGQVPGAVNTAGFVPLAARADAGGSTKYQMELIVPAASPVKSPADLKGKTLGLVALSSNSGGKAPLVLLKNEFKLLPGRDYRFTFTGTHDRAIQEVAAGRLDAAAVANDILQRLTGDGTVKADAVRSVYKSASFPRVCFGVSNALDPAVRAAVLKGLTEVDAGGLKFAPVDYKADWQDVRDIDRKLAGLVE